MSYIGRGVDAISNVEKLDNITFDGSATYALEKSSAAFTPVGANNILVSIDGVIQQGNFSVSTTNIVFDWSPTSSNTCNFILHYGTGVLNVPADGSIVAAKMAANSVDSDSYVDGSIDAVHLSANSVDSDAYVDGSIDTAHIGATQVTGAKLNTDVISAQTELASAPADTDEFMVSDGGVLKRIDYSLIKGGGITAASQWRLNTQFQGDASPIASNLEVVDTDGYGGIGSAMTQSSGNFTFPSTGIWLIEFVGRYYMNADSRYDYNMIYTTTDGTNYGEAASGTCFIQSTEGGYATASGYTSFMFDVTNVSTHLVQFRVDHSNDGGSGVYNMADSGANTTFMTFTRLGDT